jgi:hypothetical protein
MRTSVSAPLAALGAALLLLLIGARPASSAPWRWPVPPGPARIVHPYRFDARSPFARGQRRGVDLRAAPGDRVRAVCAGRVVHAGPVPLRGLGVTIRCGSIKATELGLGALAVRRGASVAAGSAIGAVGWRGVLRLGGRIASLRFGYVDPLGLLPAMRGVRRLPPLGAAPRSLSPPRALVPVAPGAAHRARPVAPVDGAPAARPAAPAVPALGWAGVALLAGAVPLGGLVHRRRRAQRASAHAAAREGA